jgi:hypothetical protein
LLCDTNSRHQVQGSRAGQKGDVTSRERTSVSVHVERDKRSNMQNADHYQQCSGGA